MQIPVHANPSACKSQCLQIPVLANLGSQRLFHHALSQRPKELRDSNSLDRKGLFPSAGLATLIVCCSFLPFMKGCACNRDRVIVPIHVFTAAAEQSTIEPLLDAFVWLWPFPFAVVVTVTHLIAMASSQGMRFRRLRLGLILWSGLACSSVSLLAWKTTRWEISWIRRYPNHFRLQFGIRYIMLWTVIIAFYCLWIGFGSKNTP
jgi:hypothetical protein